MNELTYFTMANVTKTLSLLQQKESKEALYIVNNIYIELLKLETNELLEIFNQQDTLFYLALFTIQRNFNQEPNPPLVKNLADTLQRIIAIDYQTKMAVWYRKTNSKLTQLNK